MLPHHEMVYKKLQAEFPDADVFIATSDKVEGSKSPFSFEEKKQIITQMHGIPEENMGSIFDPFFTTKPVGKGTGQGLALAKDTIVKGHGGKLTLVEKDGFATTFLIQLPLKGELQQPLIDTDADTDTESDLEGEEPDVNSLRDLIRKGTLNMSFVPVLCGSAFKNKGVQLLLDAFETYHNHHIFMPFIPAKTCGSYPCRTDVGCLAGLGPLAASIFSSSGSIMNG